MGIEEAVLDIERRRGEKLGERRGMKQGIEQGIERGIEHKTREVILNMIQKKLTDETIADLADVRIDYVQKIRNSLE